MVWICFENHENEDRDKRVCSLVLSQVTEKTLPSNELQVRVV